MQRFFELLLFHFKHIIKHPCLGEVATWDPVLFRGRGQHGAACCLLTSLPFLSDPCSFLTQAALRDWEACCAGV